MEGLRFTMHVDTKGAAIDEPGSWGLRSGPDMLDAGHPAGGAATVESLKVQSAGDVMEHRERLDFALEATQTGLWSYDARDGLIDGDGRVQALMGLTGQPSLPVDVFLRAMSDESAAQFRALLRDPEAAQGAAHELEFPIRRLDDGSERWIAFRARRTRHGGDVVGSARDVTETKRNDHHVHLLMREVTHRSKNLLAIIQAMARQTVKDSLTAADFEARFSARLRGLSFSHELLARQDWRGASLAELAEGHLSHLRERFGTRVQIGGPIVFIRPEAAQNIGLALNELGSNAQQFGALSGVKGTVRLEWHIDADETGPKALHIVWAESGASTDVEPPVRHGFGHKVMERVVARALDGVVEMIYPPTGLRWSLRVPLSHLASETDG